MSGEEGLTRRFCRQAVRFDLADLPAPLARRATLLVLDTIGCALGALQVGEGQRFAKAGWAFGDHGAVTAWGGGGSTTTPVGAAFLHGNLANLLDAEDTFRNYGHFCAAVVPAALAVAEARDCDGRELLGAIVAGYEAAARLALALPILLVNEGKIHWSETGGHGWLALPAAIAAGRLLLLDELQLCHALGLAAFAAPPPTFGRWWHRFPMTMGKYMLYGAAASAGVAAATMAQAGVTGDTDILEGEGGLWQMMGAASFAPAALEAPFGAPWWLAQAAFKLYPCSRQLHASLDAVAGAMRQARAQGFGAGDIERVEIFAQGAVMARHYQNPDPQDAATGCFSLPYAAALLLLEIPAGPQWHRDETRRRADVRALLARVHCQEWPSATARVAEQLTERGLAGFERNLARAEVTAGGRSFSATIEHPLGDQWVAAAAISDSTIEAKFRHYSSPMLGAAATEGFITACRGLAEHDSIRPMLQLLRGAV